MPEFKRTYTQPFVDKVLPALLAEAEIIEGATRVQEALEARGADQDSDGVYQIGSIAAREQVGILFDRYIRQVYLRWKRETDVESAEQSAAADAAATYEDGGTA